MNRLIALATVATLFATPVLASDLNSADAEYGNIVATTLPVTADGTSVVVQTATGLLTRQFLVGDAIVTMPVGVVQHPADFARHTGDPMPVIPELILTRSPQGQSEAR